MFDGKYIPLNKNGTFGWTKLTYVGEVKEKKQAGPSLRADGPRLFLGRRRVAGEGRHGRPADREAGARRGGVADRAAGRAPGRGRPLPGVRLPQRPAWKTCYACGTPLGTADGGRRRSRRSSRSPRSRTGTRSPAASSSRRRATEGRKALRIDRSYVSMEQPQDWLGYDFLKADLDTDATEPMNLVRRDPRHRHARLLDPGQLHDGRAAGQEHADHPREATVRGREVAAGPDARSWTGSPGWSSASATSRPRRSSSTTSAWSATTGRAGELRGPACLRLRHEHQPGHGGVHADHARPRSTVAGRGYG